MKKNYFTLSSIALIAVVTLLQSNASGPASNGNRATGAPGDNGSTCVTCHSGGSFGSVSVNLTLLGSTDTIGVSEYVPGETYQVWANVNHSAGTPSAFGIQMVVLDNSTNTSAGSWSSPNGNVKITNLGSRDYLEHNAPSASNTFGATWTAPAAGTGPITFYYGANAVNGNGNNGSDNATIGQVTFAEVGGDTTDTTGNGEPEGLRELTFNENRLTVYPNPAQNIVFVEGYTDIGTVNLYSINGVLVKTAVLNQDQLDVSELEAGIYFIQADSKLGRFVKL